MGKKYIPNIGETAKIVTSKVKENLGHKSKKRKHKRIESFKSGSFKNCDLKYLIRGIEFIQIIGDAGIEAVMRNLSSNNEELKPETIKLMTILKIGKGPLFDFLSMYRNSIHSKFDTQREISNLENMYDIIQNSRDGVITRKKTIKEKDENGIERDVEIEISMTEGEIANIIKDYEHQLYYIQDNKLYKNVARLILNGSEEWEISSFTNDTILSVFLNIKDMKSSSKFLMNQFRYIEKVLNDTDYEYCATGGGSIRIGIYKSRLNSSDVQGFKQWLSENPVEIYYQLEAPTTTDLEPSGELKTFEDLTYISNSANSEMEVKYYSKDSKTANMYYRNAKNNMQQIKL